MGYYSWHYVCYFELFYIKMKNLHKMGAMEIRHFHQSKKICRNFCLFRPKLRREISKDTWFWKKWVAPSCGRTKFWKFSGNFQTIIFQMIAKPNYNKLTILLSASPFLRMTHRKWNSIISNNEFQKSRAKIEFIFRANPLFWPK